MKFRFITLPLFIFSITISLLNSSRLQSQTLINLLWDVQLNYPDTVQWSADKLNSSSDLFTTGNTWHNDAQKVNMITTKRNSSGTLIWQTEYNGTLSGYDYGSVICLDGSGNVFVAGATHNTSAYTFDIVVIKYNSSGTQQWATLFNGSGSGMDIPSGICLDGSGNIYVCGASMGSTTGYDYVTIKLNSSGTTQWAHTYDYTSLSDLPGYIAWNSSTSKVGIAGASQSSATNWDYTTIKYNSSGSLTNTNRTSTTGYGFDRPTGLVTDASDNYFITGYAYNGTDYDLRTIKLDDDLSPIWTRTEDGGDEDGSNGIAIDGSNNTYICGFSSNGSGKQEMQIIKYNSSGTKQWTQTLSNADNSIDAQAMGIAYNSTNSRVVITGYYKYSTGKKVITTYALAASNGALIWKTDYPNINASIDVPKWIEENGNHIWVTGTRTVDDTTRYVTIKYETLDRNDIFLEDTLGNFIYPINYIIISFNPDSVNAEFVDDKQQQFGNLQDIITTPTYNSILPFLKGENQQFVPKAIKIYKRMVTGDTISISRLGDVVKVPKLWSDFVVSIDTTVDVNDIIDSLNSGKDYIYRGAYKDYVAVPTDVPDDPMYEDDQASLHSTVDISDANINIEPAWDIYNEGGNSDIKVGDYDSGLNWAHEDFGDGTFEGSKIEGGDNYVDGVDIFSVAHNDETGHGTATASLIGALRNNSLGISGIAGGNIDDDANSGCSLYLMKIFGNSEAIAGETATTSEIADAVVEGALSPPYGYGLHVSNHSYGFLMDYYNDDYDAVYLKFGFEQMFLNQSVCAVSSGNVNALIDLETPTYPSSFPDYWVIKTGANDATGDRADFSVYNNLLDLIAPGTYDLYYACEPFDDHAYTNLSGGYELSGTSFAAPHVAGTAALMLSYVNNYIGAGKWNNLAPADVEELMQRYAVDIAPTDYDIFTGHGRLDAGNVFEHIEFPNYSVRHYEPNVSTTSAVKIADDELFFLAEPYGTLSAGLYYCDQYKLTVTVSHDIGDADLLNYWDLDASSNVWAYTDYVINPLPDITFESCDESSATLTGYFYYFDYKGVYPFDNVHKWYPCSNTGTTKMAYTLHIYDPTPSSIDEIDNLSDISIFPNPGTNYFNLINNSNSQKTIDKIQIHDMTGKILIESDINNSGNLVTFNSGISNLSSGMYFITIFSGATFSELKWFKI